jgi:hypothetical protein
MIIHAGMEAKKRGYPCCGFGGTKMELGVTQLNA